MAALPSEVAALLRTGCVIPAHPLALSEDLRLDECHQRGLTRYYCAAGAGGVAVGVHTTQFEIHDPQVGLMEPVLALAAETVTDYLHTHPRPFIRIAGLIGPTDQALREAELARRYGYHAGLLSLAAHRDASDEALLAHCREVAAVIPVMGFYLQPAVGGRILSYRFWRAFVEIENVVAIKVAPFNRYQTLDVARAVAESGRDVALYTGNDDAIVADLLTNLALAPGRPPVRFVGGLLGQWAVWTRRAVEMLDEIRTARAAGTLDYRGWLARGAQLTDANAAIFDVAHGFQGSIAGIHYVLQRQGLMRGVWTLNPRERLSPGQAEAIERVGTAYPALVDDDFVAAHREEWLR